MMMKHNAFHKFMAIALVLGLLLVAAGSIDHALKSTTGQEQPPVPVQPPAQPTGLLFVQNDGQFDPQVRFQLRSIPVGLRSAGEIWWFTDDAVWLTVFQRTEGTQGTEGTEGIEGTQNAERSTQYSSLSPCPLVPLSPCHSTRGVNLKLTFPGMDPAAHWSPADSQPSKMNYFRGNNTANWRANVPTFSSLRWTGVQPGVDVVVGDQWLVGSTATRSTTHDPLQLHVEGADGLHLDQDGRVVADTAIGLVPLPLLLSADNQLLNIAINGTTATLNFQSPISRRSPNGGDLQSPISSARTPEGVNPQSPTNDPADLLYSTFLGGAAEDFVYDIALGSDGSTYITGSINSTDFPTTPGAFDLSENGGYDGFLTKLNPSGTAIMYSTYLGGSAAEFAYSVAVDAAGSAYLAGVTGSTDFPTTTGAYRTTNSGGGGDCFITRLSNTGSTLLFSTYLGGSGQDQAFALAVYPVGGAYLTGVTSSTDFPVTTGAYHTTYYGGSTDTFVTEISANGTRLLYSTYLGSIGADQGLGIATDSSTSVWVAGFTAGSNFPTTTGAYDTSFNGVNDAFITKINNLGSALVYSTFLGTSGTDEALDLAVDSSGNAYVVGQTNSASFPSTPGAYDTSYNGSTDSFVTKLNSSGAALAYSTYLGGSGAECSGSLKHCAIALDTNGSAYVHGSTASSNFPTTADAYSTSYSGSTDAFVSVLTPAGSTLSYSTYLGGSGSETCDYCGIATDGRGSAFVVGATHSSGFPTTAGAYDTTYNGGNEGYVSKLHVVEP